MRKNYTLVAVVLCMVALSGAKVAADTSLDQLRYDEERQHNQLLDMEKSLLQQSDSLAKDIDELKKEIAERVRKLELAHNKLDRARRDLISVRMKLMP